MQSARHARERDYPPLRCTVEDQPRATVIRVAGEVDLFTVEIFRDALDCALTGDRSVIVDLRDLRYIDSTGLKVLMRCCEALTRQGHRLAVSSLARPVERVMEVVGLRPMLSIYPDLPAALVAVSDA